MTPFEIADRVRKIADEIEESKDGFPVGNGLTVAYKDGITIRVYTEKSAVYGNLKL